MGADYLVRWGNSIADHRDPTKELPIASDQPDPVTVGDVGEFGLIARVTRRLPRGADVLVGPGDDAAVVAAPDGRVVTTTDVLLERVHFRLDWSTPYDVGRKAAAQNLADIVACGARPTALVVGLGVPAGLPVAWVEALADGLADEAALTGASVVGGDMVASDAVLVAVTALGDLGGREPLLRSGARAGDRVAVAGRLGWSNAGWRELRAGVHDGPLVEAHRRPTPPYAAAAAAAGSGATSMIDVSDGLLADLGHVARASRVRIDLDLAALRALGGGGVTDEDILTGGEDHALAFTLPQGAAMPDGAHPVGQVRAGEGVYVDGLPHGGPGGHRHF